jgi:hypothetical protein
MNADITTLTGTSSCSDGSIWLIMGFIGAIFILWLLIIIRNEIRYKEWKASLQEEA